MPTPSDPNYIPGKVLRKPADWRNLRFYQKSDTLFLLTCAFCERFLPKYGDRTVDQMVQAARSGKQNIIEGSEAGKTSTETELKLINVARASIGELREDYRDHINKHHLVLWQPGHPRYQPMQDFTKVHNTPEQYMLMAEKWDEEEFCNICLTLSFQIDAMINSYLMELEKTFVTEGGIKERMHKARTGFRDGVDERLRQLEQEKAQLKSENDRLLAENTRLLAESTRLVTLTQEWEKCYNDLKDRALNAYKSQQKQIADLQSKLGV